MRPLFPIGENNIAFILSITLASLVVAGCQGGDQVGTVTSVPAINADYVALVVTISTGAAADSPAAEATMPAKVRDDSDSIPPCYRICPVDETSPATDEPPMFGAETNWVWLSFVDPVKGETPINDARYYSLLLSDDGAAVLTGVCRTAVGHYTRDGDRLTLHYKIPMRTDETCAEGPSEELFFQLMQHATGYRTEDDRLFIYLRSGEGELVFERQ